MPENNGASQQNIEQFRLSNALLKSYSSQNKETYRFSQLDIEKLILNGLDYVLEGTNQEGSGVVLVHRWLQVQQYIALEEISGAINDCYQAAVGQSFAWGMLDKQSELNGYKCDIDILIEKKNVENFQRDLAKKGHHRRVIDVETGELILIDEDIEELPGKAFVGSIVIPFALARFDLRTQGYIRKLAGVYQPLNIPQTGEPYLMYGIDAVYAYGNQPIDMLSSTRRHGGIRIQSPEHNAVTTLVRLYYSLKLGYLKPNLLLIALRMINEVDASILVNSMKEYQLTPFLKMYIEYHRHFMSFEKYEAFTCLMYNDKSTFVEFSFHEVYESLENLIEGSNG